MGISDELKQSIIANISASVSENASGLIRSGEAQIVKSAEDGLNDMTDRLSKLKLPNTPRGQKDFNTQCTVCTSPVVDTINDMLLRDDVSLGMIEAYIKSQSLPEISKNALRNHRRKHLRSGKDVIKITESTTKGTVLQTATAINELAMQKELDIDQMLKVLIIRLNEYMAQAEMTGDSSLVKHLTIGIGELRKILEVKAKLNSTMGSANNMNVTNITVIINDMVGLMVESVKEIAPEKAVEFAHVFKGKYDKYKSMKKIDLIKEQEDAKNSD